MVWYWKMPATHRRQPRAPRLRLPGSLPRRAPRAAPGLTHHSDADSQCGLCGHKSTNLPVPCPAHPSCPAQGSPRVAFSLGTQTAGGGQPASRDRLGQVAGRGGRGLPRAAAQSLEGALPWGAALLSPWCSVWNAPCQPLAGPPGTSSRSWGSPPPAWALHLLTFDDGILDEVHLLPEDGSQLIGKIP